MSQGETASKGYKPPQKIVDLEKSIIKPIKISANDEQYEEKQPENHKKIKINKIHVEGQNKIQKSTIEKIAFIVPSHTKQSYSYSNGKSIINLLKMQVTQFSITNKKPPKLGFAFKARSIYVGEQQYASTQLQKLNALIGGSSTDASTQNLNFISSNFLSPNIQDHSQKPNLFNVPSQRSKVYPYKPVIVQKRSSNLSSFHKDNLRSSGQGQVGHQQQNSDSEQLKLGLIRAQTFVSHMTQSLQTIEDIIDPKDQQQIINFRIQEEKQVQSDFINAQSPYMHLKITDSDNQSENRDHLRKRVIFSSLDELDSCVSENNYLRRIQFKGKLSYQDWLLHMQTQVQLSKQKQI
ncbi:UNKNOWN [Stylonychia lemnae]|uniref:Uncharacterized protein n=1 Tax=Stylonychia lemnae TaxID=5949 RepID=A0A077ZYT4_STYLE|nr:UNKNOWN [Stylonychia lemnae]|eukprot:CDW75070.1 UNKNOWN [Stylonychia lemnae]